MPINIPAGAKVGDIVGKDFGAKTIFGQYSTTWVLIEAPKLPPVEVGKLSPDQLHTTKANYNGEALPMIWGAMRLGGTMIWATDLVEHTKTIETTDASGAIHTEIDYSYTVSLAVAFCAARRTGSMELLRVYADDLVIYGGGDLGVLGDNRHQIEFYGGNGSDPLPPGTFDQSSDIPTMRHLAYMVIRNLDLTKHFDNKIPNFSAVVSSGGESVGSILGDLFREAGLTEDDYDLDGACNGVDGFVLTELGSVRDAIAPLLLVYATDLAEVDGQLVAIHQGCGASVTIDADDLGAVEWGGSEPEGKVQVLRGSDLELPQRVDITYLDADRNWEQATQSAFQYGAADSARAESITVPIVMSADQARAAAERILRQRWLQRTQYNFSLPLKYLRICPGTVCNLPVGGGTVRVKITSVDLGLFAEMRLGAVLDADYMLTQIAPGSPATLPEQPFDGIFSSRWTVWSTPIWRDADADQPGFYVAATGSEGWTGAEIYFSQDGGTTYLLAGFVGDRTAWGSADTVLPTWTAPSTVDTTSSLTVGLELIGAAASSTQPAVDAGANTILVGQEIAGFVNATPGAAQVYTLDHFRRGQRGTSMTGHAAGERFVILTPGIARVRVPLSAVGSTLLVKLIVAGETLDDVAPKPVYIAAPTPPVGTGPAYKFNNAVNSQYFPLAF